MQMLLRGDGIPAWPRARHWSRPAVGYWISGPDNSQRGHDQGPVGATEPPSRIARVDGGQPRPVEGPAPAEPLLQPAA